MSHLNQSGPSYGLNIWRSKMRNMDEILDEVFALVFGKDW